MRLYLSGPMTGHEDWNYPAFNATAARLRAAGHEVFNPAENDNGSAGKPREFYLRLDVEAVSKSDALAVLPGWERSEGANLEVHIARHLAMPVYDANTMELIEEVSRMVPNDEPRQRLYETHGVLCKAALELMRQKNQDYAAGNDPYRNFRMFGGLGFLVRLSDKLSRLRSFEERGTFVVGDEGLRDTIIDIINYAILYYQFKQEELHGQPKKEGGTTRNPLQFPSVWCGETSTVGSTGQREGIQGS